MSTHRFILEPYKGIATRHTCPECHKKRSFARYIDTEEKIEFSPYVGRCNHEQSCGYHFTPKDFLRRMRHSQRMRLFHIRREKCQSRYPLLI